MHHRASITGVALLSFITAFSGVAAGASSGGGQWTVVATYPIPEGASGLAWDGTWLYCGIYGVNGGEVYRIDPANGSSVLHFTGPQQDAFGLTYDGTHLWTTHHPGGSNDPALALKLDTDGTVLDQIALPAHYVSGIAFDDGDFWIGRYFPDPGRLYKIDGTGAVLDEFTAPDDQPWDVCVENGMLWVADYWGDALHRVDPVRGQVLETHASEGVDPAGIVWDGTHLWYCDNGAGGVDYLYKVDLSGIGTPDITVPDTAHEYGLVAIGDMATWNVGIQNTGDAPLQIDAVTFDPPAGLSCPAVFPVTIPVGGNTTLPLVFAPAAFGPLDATATIVSNDPVEPGFALSLTGNGVEPDATIDVAMTSHDYGGVRQGATTRWYAAVSNHGNQPLTIDALVVNGAGFYVDSGFALPRVLAPLESVDLGVWFNPAVATPYAATLEIHSNDAGQDPAIVTLTGVGVDTVHPIGDVLWTYTIDTSFDNTPKAIAPIADVSGDGIADVIVCSEDDFVRCFNGNASGTGDVLWEHEIPGGSVYQQKALQIMPDIDEDGLPDVVVGAAWGGKLIRAISGGTGEELWTYDTDVVGDGGWVYQVDASRDFNLDGSVDVLACAGDDGSDTGPKRVYCLNGLSGALIWQRPLGGPVFAVIAVDDFTDDGTPDVVAGASNEDETQGRAVGIDGRTSDVLWSFDVVGSSVWALAPIADISEDGIPDVAIGDFSFGAAYGLDVTTGAQHYVSAGFGLLTSFVRLDDVDGDGGPDFVPTHLGTFARAVKGSSGAAAWTTPLVDKPAAITRIPDISGDGVNDVVLGTLFSNNRVYYLDGVSGAALTSLAFGTPVDGIGAIPDVTGDGSWEVVVGGRDGTLTCLSGGLAVATDPADVNGDGAIDFQDLLAILSAWGPNPGDPADVDGNGVVDFQDLLAVLASWTG